VNSEESSQASGAAITHWLRRWHEGDTIALTQLTDAVYQELRRLAALSFLGESGARTIQPTALVHELYLQLPGVQGIDWQSRAQFLSVASKMMRNILVDHARKRRAGKRTPPDPESWPDARASLEEVDALSVHQALERFADKFPRQAQVVELRFFGGLTTEQTVEVLKASGQDSSIRTVERDWTFARAWLQNAIRTY